MFKQLFITLFFLSSFELQKGYAQAVPFTATIDCNSNPNRIVAINMPPVSSPTTLWTGIFDYKDACNRLWVNSSYNCGNGGNQPRYFLDLFDFGTRLWTQYVGPVGCPIFEVPHGTWRVRGQNPVESNGSGCDGGHVLVYNTNNQWIGWLGKYDNAPMVTSNVVVTGPTLQNEVTAVYKETHGTIGNALFNYDETPKLNTQNTRNYDRWWIAIFEHGGLNRYGTLGWTFGFIPNDEINLQAVWINAGFDHFEPITSGVTYEVQFAVASQCNQSWVQANLPFFGVCTEGMPCREVFEEAEINLIPNPASISFKLSGFEMDASISSQHLIIQDLSGRVLKEFAQVNQGNFDVSDLPNGVYVVNLLGGETHPKTFKLSVVR